jgi:hypothetical protein
MFTNITTIPNSANYELVKRNIFYYKNIILYHVKIIYDFNYGKDMQLRKSTSGLRVIVLSIVLLSGISFVSTLQIEVQGQVQQQESPTPVISSTPTTPPTSTATTDSTTPSQPNPDNDPQQTLTDNIATTVQFPQSSLTVQFPPGTVVTLNPPQ